jgi:hypothetical protein
MNRAGGKLYGRFEACSRVLRLGFESTATGPPWSLEPVLFVRSRSDLPAFEQSMQGSDQEQFWENKVSSG